ncbi:MAG: SRPBCC family protein [Planctomycetota bacterium]
MLKKLLLGLVAVVLLLLVVSLFLPSAYFVERSIVVQAEPAQVFPYLNNLQEWNKWTPWTQEKYPEMKRTYSGPAEGVGAKSAWTGPDSGTGSLEIKQSDPATGIVYELAFEGFSTSEGRLAMAKADGGLKVTMSTKGDLGSNPINKFFGLMIDSMMGAEFEGGLAKLKQLVEAKR